MKLGASALHFVGKPFRELVEAMARSDVKYWELVDEATIKLNARRIAILQGLRETYGFEYVVHAPFADTNIASLNSAFRRMILKRLDRSIQLAGKLECSIWIVHPGGPSGLSEFYRGKDRLLNIESIRHLAREASNFGITVCVENMPEPFLAFLKRPLEIRRFFDAVARDDVKLSLDIGHAHTVAPLEEFLGKLADVIAHLHVHDNDGSFDQHLPIGDGTVEWDRLSSWIKKSRYAGLVIVETFSDPLPELEKLARLLH